MTEGLTAGMVMALVLGLIGWGFKRLISSLIAQNKTLVTEALVNMKANTNALSANTQATMELSQDLKQDRAVREERDRTLFKQLDRIEAKHR